VESGFADLNRNGRQDRREEERMRKSGRIKWAGSRLFGDEAGGVMMEYVILGLLVAAAAVVAVMYFGKNITMGFNAMSQTVSGQSKAAEKTVVQSKVEAAKGAVLSEVHRRVISDQ
jgi:Flp pilus assembly pilin Flp